jgi:hypothetical protein
MINKQNEEKQLSPQESKDSGIADIAHMDVQVHLQIKDKDTGKSLVNQRG